MLSAAGLDIASLDKAGHFHPFTSIADQQAHGPHVIASGNGIMLRDAQGREYIDSMAGLWCVSVGYGRERIARVMAAESRKLSYYHSFMGYANEPATLLADKLRSMAPGSINRAFFGCSGSDANDTHIKLIWQYNNLRGRPFKKKILARGGAYHGVTVASASLAGLPHLQARFDLPVNDRFVMLSRPSHYWEGRGMSESKFVAHLVRELDAVIAREGAETIAAFFVEPVQGAAGVIVPPKGYFDAIIPILRRHDILVVSDEVVSGFGRLGKLWGCERYDFQPDLMTLAKGLTSGYFPMSASLVSDEIWSVFANASSDVGPFAHGYTYTAHPVGAAVALENLAIMEEEGLVENAASVGEYFQKRLADAVADHPLVGEKRGVGLIAAVELVADKATGAAFNLKLGVARKLYDLLLAEGLIARPIFNSIAFSPPLILTREQADEIVERFSRGLSKLTEELRREGIWQG